jgi:low temperature requirement protein LtrA
MSDHASTPQKRRLVLPMLPRSPDEKHRVATTLELFFDLVFVVAVAQASSSLHHGIAEAHFSEAISGYILAFFAIWWAWMNFTWFASAYDVDDVPYRLLVFLQLTGAIIFAAGIPSFMEGDRTIAIGGYVVMRLAMVVQWLRAGNSDPPRRTTAHRYAVGIGLAQVLWVLSLFIPFWQVGITVALIIAELLVPVWAERAEPTTWHPHHIAERYGLFTIIVLGESILSLSLGFRSVLEAGEVSPILVGIVAGGLLILFCLWWSYFDWPMYHLLGSFRGAFLWSYGHFFIFASAAAVGAGLAVEIDYATHHSEISAVAAGAAVAIPVAIYLTLLWLLFGAYKNPSFLQRFLIPIAVVLILTTPYWGEQTALWIGLILVGLLAFKLISRQSYQPD